MSRWKWFHRPTEPVDVVQQAVPLPATATSGRNDPFATRPAVPHQMTSETRWGTRNARKLNRGSWPDA